MLPTDSSRADVQIVEANGKVLLTIPWGSADEWQARFRKQGIGSTLHLDPATREARIEPWTNLTVDRVRHFCDECTGAVVSAELPGTIQ